MSCRGIVAALVVASVFATPPLRAQGLPGAGNDEALTMPPAGSDDVGPKGVAVRRAAPGTNRRSVTPQGSQTKAARQVGQRRRDATVANPVDFGVTMRGGSATSHLYAPLAGSQAVRESGGAFGAGVRFGF